LSHTFPRHPQARDLPPAPCSCPGIEGSFAAPAQDTDFKLREYWNIIHKRRWTIIAAVIIVVTLSALVSFRTKPLYEAAGRIAIFRETPLTLNKDTRSDTDDDYSIDIDTQVRILQSDTLALDVAQRTGLHQNRAVVGADAVQTTSARASNDIDPHLQPALLSYIHNNLHVLPLAKTRIIEIRFTSTDPKLAAAIVNATAAAYIEQNFKARYDATVQTSEWLSREMSDLQTRAESAQEKLVAYQRQNGIVEIGDKQDVVTSKLDDLNKELTAAEADRIHKEAAYRMAADAAGNVRSDGNTLADKLREKQADLRTQFAQMNTQLGPNHPKLLEVKSQLDEVDRNLQAEEKRNTTKTKNEYLAALEREKLLRTAFDAQKDQANQLNGRSVQFSILKRDVETSRALYESLLQRLKEAGVLASIKSSNVHIVDAARVPTHPSKPNIPQNLTYALGAGLFGGLILAFALEALDNTVRTPEQMRMISGLPSLGIIPFAPDTRATSKLRVTSGVSRSNGSILDVALVTSAEPTSVIAESYRALRTSILLSTPQHPPQVILVSSSLPQEGKTTTCINTATVLAQKNARVLLIDADLRRPSIHRHLGLHDRQGLSSVLAGSCTLEQAICAVSATIALFVLPAGPLPPSPSELLASPAMREVIEQCRDRFDYILIDTPPVLSVTDAVLLSAEVDACLLVVRAATTTKAALLRTRDLLRQVNARVMGSVLNAVNLESQDAYYYNYHYYGRQDSSCYAEANHSATSNA
jgi:polysaccharide biosynthesis transport protein